LCPFIASNRTPRNQLAEQISVWGETTGLKKVTVHRLKQNAEKSIGRAVQRMKRARARIFDGDAHAFLVSVYRNAAIELEQRIKAAGLALPYERPRLASTSVTVRHISEWTEEELAAAAAAADAEADALEGRGGQLASPNSSETRH
jgi:hypothetical protein